MTDIDVDGPLTASDIIRQPGSDFAPTKQVARLHKKVTIASEDEEKKLRRKKSSKKSKDKKRSSKLKDLELQPTQPGPHSL